MTVPNKIGRPRAFNNPEELQKGIDDYFSYIDAYNDSLKEGEKPKPYTMSGICVYIGISKETLWDYAKKPIFSDSVKAARARVENCVEEGSLSGKWNTIGAIFNLKNNFGWVDKIDINTNSQPEQLTSGDIQEKLKELKDRN